VPRSRRRGGAALASLTARADAGAAGTAFASAALSEAKADAEARVRELEEALAAEVDAHDGHTEELNERMGAYEREIGDMRAQVLNLKVEDFIEAARAVGNPPLRIALRHVLPNVTAPLVVQATLAIASAVIAEASLSFLGLGQQPPAPSWGSMLNTAKNFIDNAPWMAIWPGLAIFALVLSFNLLGDGLRDALDPRQR
jgi:hypothetical protein